MFHLFKQRQRCNGQRQFSPLTLLLTVHQILDCFREFKIYDLS